MPKAIKPILRINKLYTRGVTILSREIERLYTLSIGDKLSLGHAKDLRDYMKLLADMKEAHEAIQADQKAKEEAASKALTEQQMLEMMGKE